MSESATPRCLDCDNKVRAVHLYPVGNAPRRSHPVRLAIEAEAAAPASCPRCGFIGEHTLTFTAPGHADESHTWPASPNPEPQP